MGLTDAQKRAHKKYLQSFHEFKLRMEEDLYLRLKQFVDTHKTPENGLSINMFIKNAIVEKLDREE